MYIIDNLIDLSALKDYIYCKHRFGLIHNNCANDENFLIVKGTLAHQVVETGKITYSKSKITERSVKVHNDIIGLYGIVDCIEFIKKANGVYVKKFDNKFTLNIVEYKVTAPKNGEYRFEDSMQLLGQKLCVDKLYNTDCKTFLFYSNIKERIEIKFTKEDYDFLEKTLKEIHKCLQDCSIPPIESDQNCKGCSLENICIPKLVRNEK